MAILSKLQHVTDDILVTQCYSNCYTVCVSLQLEETLNSSLQSDDELFHVTLYSWMKTYMPDKLVEVCVC